MRRLNTYKDCADRTWFGKLFQQLVRRHAKVLVVFLQASYFCAVENESTHDEDVISDYET